MITENRLKCLVSYNSETGIFTWKTRPSNRVRVGDIAGTLDSNGYIYIKLDGKRYFAHRLSWLYMYGQWPVADIDHKNGIRNDNRIENLRLATKNENQQNRKLNKNNTSGYMGVYYDQTKNKWVSKINVKSIRKHLGYYDTSEEAYSRYVLAKAEYHTFQPTIRDS